jgi:hypothetical protein
LEALEDAGGEMVYFEVILVCGVVSGLVKGRRGRGRGRGKTTDCCGTCLQEKG